MKQVNNCLILFLIFFASAFAQFSEKFNIFVTTGSSTPVESYLLIDFNKKNNIGKFSTSNFKDYWNAGINLAGGLEYKLVQHLKLLATFSYSHFSANENSFRNDIETLYSSYEKQTGIRLSIVNFDVYRGNVNIYTLAIGGKASFTAGILTPYLNGGGGYMRLNLEPIEMSALVDPQEYNASFSYRIPGDTSDSFMGYGGVGLIFNLSKNIRPFAEVNYIIGITDPNNTIFYSYKAGLNFGFH